MRLVGQGRISARLQDLQRKVSEIKDFAADEFRKVTPIRTGNARSNTRRIAQGVEGAYPYANRLNEGYSSQAPAGMTDPTVEKLNDYVRRM